MKLFRHLSRKPTAGYTLIEMLAIVVIVAVLAAIATPSWLAYANRQRVNAVESDLVQFLQRAQQQAIKERRSVTVNIENTDGFPTASKGSSAEQLGPTDIRANTIVLDPASETVTFDYKGTVASSTLPIVVNISPRNSDIQHCVMVTSILGNIKTSRDAAVCDNPSL